MVRPSVKFVERFKPGIPRRALFFVAASVWGIAGGILCTRGWTALVPTSSAALPFADGAAGALFYYLMFARIPKKHIQRIASITHPFPCAFSFLDWRGYIVMATMITLGISLRLSGLLSPRILGTVYIVMGVALLLAAIRFAAAGMKVSGLWE